MEIKVSICVPVYGVENYIERCAVSLFEQTYSNIEYVFVNDQSPDNSWNILHKVIARYPKLISRVKLLEHDKNRGSAAVRNTALVNASGDYIMWVDSDDYIETDAVERCISVVAEKDTDVVLFNYQEIKIGGNRFVKIPHLAVKERTIALLKREIPVCLWCGIIRRSLYTDNNIKFKDDVNNGEDFSVMPRLAFWAKKVSYIDEFLYHYDCTRENTYTRRFSRDKSQQMFGAISVLEKFFSDKSSEYKQVLIQGKMKYIIGELVASATFGDKEYFYLMSRELDKFNSKYIASLTVKEKLPFYIRNPYFIKYFVKIGHFIKNNVSVYNFQRLCV